VAYANQRGGTDNISVAVIEIGQPVEAGVVPSAGGTVPTEVTFDEMLTQPSVMFPQDDGGFRLTRLTIALLAGAIVLAAGAIVIFVPRILENLTSADGTPAAETPLLLETEGTLSPPTDLLATGTEELPTSTPVTEQSPTETPSPESTEGMGCIYIVQDGDGIYAILRGFGFNSSDSISLRNEIIDLETGEPLPDPDSIDPDQVLYLPFIDNKENCRLGQGLWQSILSTDILSDSPQ
jgi:hypothetical protein